MKKTCLVLTGICLMFFRGFSQETDSAYKARQLKLEEVNFVSSYYDQTADKSAVMGGRTDDKGIGNVTDFANSLDLRFSVLDKKGRKNSFDLGAGIDYHTAASQAYVDSNGRARKDGTRLYPTLDWTIENEKKGTSFGIGVYYSSENRYYHSLGFNTSFAKKTRNNGEASLKLTAYLDQIYLIQPTELVPKPVVEPTQGQDSVVYITSASGETQAITYHNGTQVGQTSSSTATPVKSRDTYTASFGFSQVINTRLQASVAADVVYQHGYLGLPFHRVYFSDGSESVENLPGERIKFPVSLRLNYFAGDMFILRAFYRFYTDNWGIVSHTASLEIPIKLSPFFSFSPFFRFYKQSAATYFAAYAVHSPGDTYFTSNYALAAFTARSFGAGLRIAPPNGIFNPHFSALEIRLNHYVQSTNLESNMISLHLTFH